MSNSHDDIWERLKYLRDELQLKAHLLSLDMKDEWHALEKRYNRLSGEWEKKLSDKIQHMGESEEHVMFGDQEEVQELLSDYDALQRKQKPGG